MATLQSVGRLSGQAMSTGLGVTFDALAVDGERNSADCAPAPDTSTYSNIDDFAMQMAYATVFPIPGCRCVESPLSKTTAKKEVSKNSQVLVKAIRSKGPNENGQIVACNILCKDVTAFRESSSLFHSSLKDLTDQEPSPSAPKLPRNPRHGRRNCQDQIPQRLRHLRCLNEVSRETWTGL